MYGYKNNPLQNISSYCETCKRKAKCITWDFYGRASLDSKVCSKLHCRSILCISNVNWVLEFSISAPRVHLLYEVGFPTGQKFFHCPWTKGQWDKLKILPRDATGRDSLSKSGTIKTPCTFFFLSSTSKHHNMYFYKSS